jgi:hypothetical protein
MKPAIIAALIFTSALLFSPGAAAQSPKKSAGVLTGTVLGADEKPVSHAAVSCESSGGMRPRAVHSDEKGRFRITGLKQDNYDLRASANGAYSDWERNIPVRLGATKEITLRLLNGNTALVGTPPPKKKH